MQYFFISPFQGLGGSGVHLPRVSPAANHFQPLRGWKRIHPENPLIL